MKYFWKIINIFVYTIILLIGDIITTNGIITILNLLGKNNYTPFYDFHLPLRSLLTANEADYRLIIQSGIAAATTALGFFIFYICFSKILEAVKFFKSDFYIIKMANPKTETIPYKGLLPNSDEDKHANVKFEAQMLNPNKKIHLLNDLDKVNFSGNDASEQSNREIQKPPYHNTELETDYKKRKEIHKEKHEPKEEFKHFASSKSDNTKDDVMPLIKKDEHEHFKKTQEDSKKPLELNIGKETPRPLIVHEEKTPSKITFDEEHFVRTLKIFSSLKFPWGKHKEGSKKQVIHMDLE